MPFKFARSALLITGIAVAGWLRAADAANEPAAIIMRMFGALEKNQFQEFIAGGDNTWRRLGRSEFDRLVTQIEPRLKGGYDIAYLGEIKRAGNIVQTLWKVTFKANGEEILANLDLKEGRVVRFGIPRI
jgi:hypothetical protein